MHQLSRRSPEFMRLANASTKSSYRSLPCACAAARALSGKGGFAVSQNLTNSAKASLPTSTACSKFSIWRTIRSRRRLNAASIRSDPSGDRNELRAASTISACETRFRIASSASCFATAGDNRNVCFDFTVRSHRRGRAPLAGNSRPSVRASALSAQRRRPCRYHCQSRIH